MAPRGPNNITAAVTRVRASLCAPPISKPHKYLPFTSTLTTAVHRRSRWCNTVPPPQSRCWFSTSQSTVLSDTSHSVSAANLFYGQPVHETHPHMLKPGEVTPGISAQEYHNRRQRLATALPPGGVAVMIAAPVKYKTSVIFHPYRQEPNLWWLTGWQEPESVAVISRVLSSSTLASDAGCDYEFTLFCRPKDPGSEQFNGPWSGLAAARDVFNADTAHPISALDRELPALLRDRTAIYINDDNLDLNPNSPATGVIRGAKVPVRRLSTLVAPLRAIKSPAEIAVMHHAGRISGAGFNRIMASRIRSEAEITALLNLHFTRDGGSGHAYVPVVASGPRGLFVHWVQNTGVARAGDLVTVDAGAEYGGYVCDVTRTWPVDGRFTPAQRDLYEAVLDVQRRVIARCRADAATSLRCLHQFAEVELSANLRQLGFDMDASTPRNAAIHTLFPHHIGHHIGVDIHDAPDHARNESLRPGNCLAIEPGIYVPDDDRWPAHFHNLGVRVEDSVCVQQDSTIVFSSSAVKEVDDIENLEWTIDLQAKSPAPKA